MSGGWIGPDGKLAAGALPRRDTSALRAAATARDCSVKVFCSRCRGLLAAVTQRAPVAAVSVYGRFELAAAATFPVPAVCRCAEPWHLDAAALRHEAEGAPTNGYRTITDPGHLRHVG